MNRTVKFSSLAVILVFLCAAIAQISWKNAEPWRPDQLMETADLAAMISGTDASKPLIISIGPAATIKESVGVGPAREAENLAKLEQLLSKESKDRAIVIYCGCCPFKNCPNIRPAFTKLNEMGFKNHKLLNITQNLKVDWLDKGYPAID
ncbi:MULTISPECIES: rhodanese-like domain-containing protein [Spirosoma]|uniref:Rhodanese-like domain-containing protein n=1 Tax=Spirosoma liriopis TaxID=2937440 RepID=A0ABT0HP60_9BACT|nr:MULTISPECIES: rhodanese-like domain-containing protein [Spirosoma]MCK8493961.1 rhodanese-like domain-containing protein [Spirosoma liriopis]UHG93611.1 rhodanese-like domain-containing protein [Spirosoma oryzicola]